MREIGEFRIPEDRVGQLFEPHEGKSLGGSVRVITIDTTDPRFGRIGELQMKLRRKGKAFFHGWDTYHRYSDHELQHAKLFQLMITAAFEPVGEDCGTIYDESTTCKYCGAGRTQVSDLRLDLRKVPKNKDIARTIANEWIVSQRLAELMLDANLTGFELRRVRHKAKYEDDPITLRMVPTGQLLLSLAERARVDPESWEFSVWLNRPQQRTMFDRAVSEYAEMKKSNARRKGKPTPLWHQLVVNSQRIDAVAPTRFGKDPFDDDPKREHVCPLGHVSGARLLSEVSASRHQYDGSDVIITRNMVGLRGGVLVPRALILISPQFYHLLGKNQIEGYRVEVAYFV